MLPLILCIVYIFKLLTVNNFILFIITLFCWSPTWYVIKFQLGYVDPLVSVFYRFLIAAIIIFFYLATKRKKLKFPLSYHIWFLFFGVCLYSLNYVFFYLSNTYLISAFPAVVFSTVVIMNILGELDFFSKLEVDPFFPLYLSLINTPSLIFEMLPFIFLISTQLFFINFFKENQIQIFKYNVLKIL